MAQYEGSLEERYLANLDCCKLPDTCCAGKDCVWFYALCAQPCIQGLMRQAALSKNGSVGKSEAGCLKSCYFEQCYPCVCTESCACLCCFDTTINAAKEKSGLLTQIVLSSSQNAVYTNYRQKLISRAGGPQNWSYTFLQRFCGVFFCVPCNDAAYIIEKKKDNNSRGIQIQIGNLIF